MSIQSVGVLGCGLMGSGIAQVCAQSGYRTVVREVDQGVLDKGLGRVRKFLDEGVQKGKVTEERGRPSGSRSTRKRSSSSSG